MCLRKLAIVDDSLEALGAPKEHQRLRNWIIRIIVGWIVYIFYKLAHANVVTIFVLQYDITFWTVTLSIFPFIYSENIIILSALISAAILGLVLHMCIHLFCKLLFCKVFIDIVRQNVHRVKHLKTCRNI